MRITRLFASSVTILMATALAAGCEQKPPAASGGGTEGTGSGQANGPASFDIFLGDKIGLIDYSFHRVRNKCLAKAGYPQNLNGMASGPERSFPYLVITDRTFGPTSEAEARQVGFGQNASAQPARIVSFDKNYDANLERCTSTAYDELGPETKKIVNTYKDLGNSLYSQFTAKLGDRVDKELPSIAPNLLACLAGKGYRPTNEADFLAEPDPAKFGVKFGGLEGGDDEWSPRRINGTVQVGPPVPAKKYRPTSAESDLAVAWFQCRRDTGLAAKVREFAKDAQRTTVAQYEDEFAELNPKIEEIARKAAQLAGD